jgi:hypothetical protein
VVPIPDGPPGCSCWDGGYESIEAPQSGQWDQTRETGLEQVRQRIDSRPMTASCPQNGHTFHDSARTESHFVQAVHAEAAAPAPLILPHVGAQPERCYRALG